MEQYAWVGSTVYSYLSWLLGKGGCGPFLTGTGFFADGYSCVQQMKTAKKAKDLAKVFGL
ncbi:MAG: hypothetical protein HFK04_00380 [Oscillospiraceae bacterium]|nr:hypothetical protein [Oscillospiraceae bacterium]